MKTQKHPPPKVIEHKYDNVGALLRGTEASPVLRQKVARLRAETRITEHLAGLREAAGVTQQQIGDALGISQSAVSKIEAGKDDDLSFKIVKAYASVTKERISFACGRPLSPVEAIQLHADALKERLEHLAEFANSGDGAAERIRKYFSEVSHKLFHIMAFCYDKLPKPQDVKESEDAQIRIVNLFPHQAETTKGQPKTPEAINA